MVKSFETVKPNLIKDTGVHNLTVPDISQTYYDIVVGKDGSYYIKYDGELIKVPFVGIDLKNPHMISVDIGKELSFNYN